MKPLTIKQQIIEDTLEKVKKIILSKHLIRMYGEENRKDIINKLDKINYK